MCFDIYFENIQRDKPDAISYVLNIHDSNLLNNDQLAYQ